MKKLIIFLGLIFSTFTFALGRGLPVNMGRTTQTLNQVDKTSDGSTTRNQGYDEEVDQVDLVKAIMMKSTDNMLSAKKLKKIKNSNIFTHLLNHEIYNFIFYT